MASVTDTFIVSGIRCERCVLRLATALEDQPGLASANANLMGEVTLTWDDEREFTQVARHLVAGDGFVASSYRANPVLPVYLAAVFRVFGESYAVARLGQLERTRHPVGVGHHFSWKSAST